MIWSQWNSCIFHLHDVLERMFSVHWGVTCRLKHLPTRKGIAWWSGWICSCHEFSKFKLSENELSIVPKGSTRHKCRQTEICFDTFIYKLHIKTWPGHHYTVLFTRLSHTIYDPSQTQTFLLRVLYTMSQLTNQYNLLIDNTLINQYNHCTTTFATIWSNISFRWLSPITASLSRNTEPSSANSVLVAVKMQMCDTEVSIYQLQIADDDSWCLTWQ